MPIVSEASYRHAKTRALYGVIYLVLIAGAITMLYPFLLMLGTSVTSHADNEEFTMWPAYLSDDGALFQKYLGERYDQDIEVYNRLHSRRHVRFGKISGHEPQPGDREKAEDLRRFIEEEIRPERITLVRLFYRMYRFQVFAAYNQWLTEQFGDLEAINRRYGETQHYPHQFQFPYEGPLYRLPFVQDSPKERDWFAFKKTVPWTWICLPSSHARYRTFLNERYANLEELNQAHGTRYGLLEEVRLPWERPPHPGQGADWDAFVAKIWPERLVETDGTLTTPERLWTERLEERYGGDLDRLSAAHQARYLSFETVPIPYGAVDRVDFAQNEAAWRWEFIAGNYITVFGFIVLNGRAGVNTLILVGGTIFLQLTVNPLCAYALSRFGLKRGFAILLFCLATMSFPAEVAMIPNFILLKEFNLLNTFWALLLPGAANGFFIFLLKGFFDSLPDELFEAAAIDGAGALRTFWQLAMPLCKPVMAVIALQAFVASYGSFMWAYIVCQDANLWTLMVYIHQFQIGNPVHLVMAALTLASIPTMIVFIFCQKIILRGIVVPTMK